MLQEDFLIEKDNKFRTICGGSSNSKKVNVFYIRAKSKITPLINKSSYESDINKVQREFKYCLNNIIKHYQWIEQDVYLADLYLSGKSIAFSKKSFLRYNIYFKTKTIVLRNDKYKLLKDIAMKLETQLSELLLNNKFQLVNP